jgi:hypothetical protein
LKHRKFLIKIDTPGLLITLKGKNVRTPVTIIASEDEVPLIKLQVKTNSAGCSIDEIFEYGEIENKSDKIEIKTEVKVEKSKKEKIDNKKIESKTEDFNFSEQVDVEELSIKYETLLDKMMKSTK